ncbi:hypothetical protein CAPTEDRAFT_220096 [Capitella teleta]|uniref:C2H2-type domain-containing protein n=1 Tax=Capitella teleta TaxID=283909 RepID=R7UWG5_CAPTE|nr:hypothetical protein CAPTEDRAFT_220096 [Capitella teleta]|eukprot:ELU08277.1 hypothetical protein CAPTEDRAFT_220096 [Capitella teleta]
MQLQAMKAEQERVKTLLLDTVSLLCKNGLTYNTELQIQGIIGVTIDQKEVFLVHLDEVYKGRGVSVLPQGGPEQNDVTASLPAHPLLVQHPTPQQPPVFNQNTEQRRYIKQEHQSPDDAPEVEEGELINQRPTLRMHALPRAYGNAVFPDQNTPKPRSGQASPSDRSQQDRKRRSWTSKDKPFKCQMKPCRKSYYYLHDLRRHHKQKHWMLPWTLQCADADDPSKRQWYDRDESALDLTVRYPASMDHRVHSVHHKMDELEALEAEYSGGGRSLEGGGEGEEGSGSEGSITDIEDVGSEEDFQMEGELQDDWIMGLADVFRTGGKSAFAIAGIVFFTSYAYLNHFKPELLSQRKTQQYADAQHLIEQMNSKDKVQ